MNFLQKIKEFFQQKPEIPEKVVEKPRISEIDALLSAKQKSMDEIFQEKINILYRELNPNLDKLQQNIKKLSEIDITKNKADEKLKKMTELGRNDYLISINKLLANLKSRESYRQDYIKDKIEEFAKQSTKSDFKVTLLIGKEVENIRNDIMRIRKLEDDFNDEHQKLLENKASLTSLLIKNKEKESKEKIKKEIAKEMKENDKSINTLHDSLDDIKNKIKEIEQSPKFEEKINLSNKLKAEETLLKEEEFKIKTLLDSKVLEKYAYIEESEDFKKLALNYINDPIKTMLADSDFQILKILDNIKEKINNNELKIKEKSLDKINITPDTLSTHKDNLNKLNGNIKTLDTTINNIDINLDDKIKEKTKIETTITENKNKLSALIKKQEKLDNAISNINTELVDQITLIN